MKKTALTTASLSAAVLVTLLSIATPGLAQTASVIYCCNDDGGRKVCGDFLPKECQKRAYEERDGRGFVIKEVEAPLSAEQQARRDAETAKKAELALQQMEERRRNQALLSTYSSEQDIDKARDRAVAEVEKGIVQTEKALAESVKRRQALDKEKEFYKNKPLPAQLKTQLADGDKDVAAKTDAVAQKKKDKEKLAASFEDEKARFRELKGGGKIPAGASATPAPPIAPAAKN